MAGTAIHLADVSKQFGRTTCLDGLRLTVDEGAVFGLLGPNGAGKTTTLRILLGLVHPNSGAVRVLGLDPLRDATRVRAQVGVLLEADGLYDRLSAAENLEYYARIHHLDVPARGARIDELLRAFGLWERRDTAVATWSKGMRQKLAIARALLHRPRLLLLDEPFTGLDPAAAVELRARIAALARDEGVTVLLTTHDLAHVEKACDRVAVILRGRVIAEGSPAELGRDDAHAEALVRGEGLDASVLAAMQREGLVIAFAFEGPVARVTCSREARPRLGVELVRRGVILEELHSRRTSLEEAFLALVAGGTGEGPS